MTHSPYRNSPWRQWCCSFDEAIQISGPFQTWPEVRKTTGDCTPDNRLSQTVLTTQTSYRFLFPAFPDNPRLCPVLVLRACQERTQPVRGTQTTEIFLIKSHKPVTASTIYSQMAKDNPVLCNAASQKYSKFPLGSKIPWPVWSICVKCARIKTCSGKLKWPYQQSRAEKRLTRWIYTGGLPTKE